MSQRTLLIIDDDRTWLRVAAKWFASFDFKVSTAATCAAGIELADATKPDCVLLDFHLTDGNGGAVCSYLRSDLKLKKIPIIMASADPHQELPSYNEHKADAFVLKGTPFPKILAIIESVLRRVNWERGILEKCDIRLEKETLQVFRDSRPTARLSPEQFHLFSILIEKSPDFVSEEHIAKCVIGSVSDGKTDAIRALLHRLRLKLGAQLGRRIKNKRNLGWIYVQPRMKTSHAPDQAQT